MKTRQSGLSKKEQVKSIVSRAKQRQNRFFDDGHPLHPTKVAVSLAQISIVSAKANTGTCSTVMLMLSLFEQPLALVIVTE